MKIEKNEVVEAVAATQDGKNLNSSDEFSAFIRGRIDMNTDDDGYTDVEELLSDFMYMINQIQRAKEPLNRFINSQYKIQR